MWSFKTFAAGAGGPSAALTVRRRWPVAASVFSPRCFPIFVRSFRFYWILVFVDVEPSFGGLDGI